MKVRDLLKALKDVPEDMIIVLSGDDHSFIHQLGVGEIVKAEYVRDGHVRKYLQYYDEENRSSENSQIVEVYWIDDGRY